jgi:hypothetical protein
VDKAKSDEIKESLKKMGIFDSKSLALWAKKRGLLGVYLEFRPKTNLQEGAWQVVRPGYKTNPNTIATNLGRQTFIYHDLKTKHTAEKRAQDWTDFTFGNGYAIGWRRIEGFGPSLFPLAVAQELQEYFPDLHVYANRQAHKKAKKK